MRTGNARLGYLRTTAMLTGAVLCMGVAGCFTQPMPLDSGSAPNADPPAEQGLDNPVEPAVENPIRPVGGDGGDVAADPPASAPDSPADNVDIPVEEFGDLNNDGLIDDVDVELFRNEFGNASDGALVQAADFDGDGAVTLVDFQIFLMSLARGE